jgi:hypothetical protein
MKVIKTQYMDKAQRGYSEYFIKDIEALKTQSPVPGDRAFLADGSLYFCWDVGYWVKIGDPSVVVQYEEK